MWGSEKYAPRLSQILDGMAKEDPNTEKKMPVEEDVPEFIAVAGKQKEAT